MLRVKNDTRSIRLIINVVRIVILWTAFPNNFVRRIWMSTTEYIAYTRTFMKNTFCSCHKTTTNRSSTKMKKSFHDVSVLVAFLRSFRFTITQRTRQWIWIHFHMFYAALQLFQCTYFLSPSVASFLPPRFNIF